MLKTLLLLIIILIPQQTFASGVLDGVWKHSAKQAWLKVDSIKGTAAVYEHHTNANAKGLIVIKDIKKTLNLATLWRGKMYAAAADSFVEVELSLPSIDCIIVTHNSEQILKLFRVPSAAE